MNQGMLLEIVEDDNVGRVLTPIRVESLEDLLAARKGTLANDQVRRIEIVEALVDTGATLLALPTRYIEQLGLKKCVIGTSSLLPALKVLLSTMPFA